MMFKGGKIPDYDYITLDPYELGFRIGYSKGYEEGYEAGKTHYKKDEFFGIVEDLYNKLKELRDKDDD